MPRDQIPIYRADSPRAMRPSMRRLAKAGFRDRFRRGRIWPDDEGVADGLGLLHRRRRLRTDRQRRHRVRGGGDPSGQRALCRAHRRLRTAGRPHRHGYRLSVDESRGRSLSFPRRSRTRLANAGAWGLAFAAIRARGKASRATCGSRRSNLVCGFTAAISHLSRHYSLFLALQIKARMEGLPTPVYGLQPAHHRS